MHAENRQERTMNDSGVQLREQRLWRAIVGRGAVGALVGLLLTSTQWRSPRAVGVVFAAYLVVDGILSLYAASHAKASGRPSSAALLVAVVDAAAAVVALAMPAILPLRLAGGVRAIVTGACDALRPPHRDASELLTLAGVAAVGLGVVIFAWPGPATVALPWLLGVEAMVSGALFVAGATSELKRARTSALGTR
jgi:uncharacterized membrane protein HdeD (DUF308 family)